MAITATERGNILELVVLMFDAAPGATYLEDITAVYEANGHNLQALATMLGDTPIFGALHPNFQTTSEFVTDFLSTIGLENDALARTIVTRMKDGGDWNFDGVNDAPMTKAQIMYTVWGILDNPTLVAGYAQQYQDAAAIMHNKAFVSEYYSVTLGGAATNLLELQDVLDGVGSSQASLDAKIDQLDDELAVGPTLTPGNDIINVGQLRGDKATNIEGIVDGDQDESISNATFNPGDNITGNGNTNLNLVVVEGGDAGFTRLSHIESVNIEAGDNVGINFNAGGWTDIGEVSLNSGVDGMSVFLDNLEAGTVINVMDITGTIAASYDTDNGNLLLSLRNNDEGGDGVTGVATAVGDVTVTGADSVTAWMSNSSGVDLGNISATLGDDAVFAMYFDDEGYSVGDVNVTVGDDGVVDFSGESISGDQTWGDMSVAAGADANVNFDFYWGEDGDLVMGNVAVTAGDGADLVFSAYQNDSGGVEVSSLSMTAGDDSNIDLNVREVDSGDITFGNVSLVAGTDSSVDATFNGQGGYYGEDYGQMVTLGDVTLTAGDASSDDGHSHVHLDVYSWSSVDVGDVDLSVGAGGSVDLSFAYISNDVSVGDVSLMGGEGSDVDFTVYEIGAPNGGSARNSDGDGAVTIGNVSIEGDDLYFSVSNGGSGSGDLTVGNVTMNAAGSASLDFADHTNTTVGDITMVASSDADIYIEGYAGTALSVDGEDTIIVVSNITVGDIHASVTADGASVSVSLDNGDDNNFMAVGNITAGDVTLVAQDDGSAYFYAWNFATSATTASNDGTAAGDISIGNLTMTVGSASDLDVTVEAYASISNYASDHGMAGDVTVGDVSVTVGDGFASGTQTNEAYGYVLVSNYGEDGVGDLTVGNVDMTGGDFATLSFTAQLGASGTDGGTATGVLTVGDISMTGGESAYINVDVINYNYGDTSSENGGIVVGNIEVLAAQDSYVTVSITADNNSAGLSMGDVTVGDIDMTIGDNSTVDLDIRQQNYLTADSEDIADGDLTIGDISIAVSATDTEDLSGGSNIHVSISKTVYSGTGIDTGALTVGDISLSAAGTGADLSVDISYYGWADNFGDVSIGTISMTAGDAAENLDVSISITNNEAGLGNVTLGGFAFDLGDDSFASVDVNLNKEGADDIGNIAVGNVELTLGDSSSVDLDGLAFYGEAGNLGDVSVGNFTATLGDNADFLMDVDFSSTGGSVGDVSTGNVTIHADGGQTGTNTLYYLVDVNANTGIGDVVVGNWDVTLGEGGSMAMLSVSISATAGDVGEVTIGDVMLDLDTSATIGGTYAGVLVAADGDIGGVTVGNISITATDGAVAALSYEVIAGGSAGDLTIGDLDLTVNDGGLTFTTTTDTGTTTVTSTYDMGGSIVFSATVDGDDNDVLTVGDVTIEVGGTAVSDEVWVTLSNLGNGDVVIGNVSVSGEGTFVLDGMAHTGDDNTSFLAVVTDGDITIGNIDFTGYQSDITLDLSWTDHGAANITGGDKNDIILDNAGANIIRGGKGQDDITIGTGTADDTVVTNQGESGKTAGKIDIITGFDGDDAPAGAGDGDKLDFNFVAGTAGNYVEGNNDAANLAEFLADANDFLNSTVKYYVDYANSDDMTYVAVNFGTGEADMVIALVGDHRSDLSFANIIA